MHFGVPEMVKLMKITKSILLYLFAAAVCMIAARAGAEPEWWKGTAKEAAQLAKQNGKWIVLYFESEKADNCIRMNAETWPKLDKTKAEEHFIWMRLEPEDNSDFFNFFEVYSTPEFVIVDGETQERARLKGFVEPDVLLKNLAEVYQPENKKKMVMTNDGQVMTEEKFKEGIEANQKANFGKHFWYESFDMYPSFERLDKKRYQVEPGLRGTSNLEPNGGKYSSPALSVSSDIRTRTSLRQHPSVGIQVKMNEGNDGKALHTVEMIEGKVRLTLALRANHMPEKPTECVQLIVYPKGSNPTGRTARAYTTTLSKLELNWQDKFIETDKVNFKTDQLLIRFYLDDLQQSFLVDDIRVDLLPLGADISQASSKKEVDPLSMLNLTNKEKSDWQFDGFDVNKDQRIEKREIKDAGVFSALFRGKTFEQLDLNRDGYFDITEYNASKK